MVGDSQAVARHLDGVALLETLKNLGAATKTSLHLPADISYERYETLGLALADAHKTVTWLIADWLNFGERAFPNRYEQAVEMTGLNKYTLINYASIARRVPPERRRPELRFSAHEPVAALPPREQEEWLDRAVVNHWTKQELRDHMKAVHHNGEITPGVISVPTLEQAARDLVASGRPSADGFYLVGRASFVDLCRALGEEI